MKYVFLTLAACLLLPLAAVAQESPDALHGQLTLEGGESATVDLPGVRNDLGVFPPFVVVSKTMMDEAMAAATATLGADASREALSELAQSLIPDLTMQLELHPEAQLLVYDAVYWLSDHIVLVPPTVGENANWDPLAIPEIAKRLDPETYELGSIQVVSWQYPVPPTGPMRLLDGRLLSCDEGHCEDLRVTAVGSDA